MFSWFGCFILYSFAGCLLETVFCMLFSFKLESRKCLLLGALCPVYGLGGVAIAAFAEPFKSSKIATFIIGMLAATLVEYIVDIFYKDVLGVSFWDYTGRPFNLNGRVWLVYSICWGVLSLLVVYKLQPVVWKISTGISTPVMTSVIVFFICDMILSSALMYSFKTKDAVNAFWLLKQLNN